MWNGTIVRRRRLGMSSAKGIAAVSRAGIDWYLHDKHKAPENKDITIRWGCTANVPTTRVLNSATAIHQVADKLGFRRILNEAELCPITYFSLEDVRLHHDWIHHPPLVVRARYHHQGRNLFVVRSLLELQTVIARTAFAGGWYASWLIDKVSEHRVCLVQGRVAWVTRKTPGNPDDVAWNVNRGGRFDNVRWGDWPLKEVRVAREAFLLSQLDFGGVDVMTDNEGNVYVLELNSAPSLTSPYRQSCMAKCFDWIMEREDKERIDVIGRRGDWKKFAHPALHEKVMVV